MVRIGNNAAEVSKSLDAIIARLQNPTPALKVAAAELDTLIDDTFRDSAAMSGERWPALAPSTLLRRALSRGGKRVKRRNKSTGYSVGVDLGLSKKAAKNISNAKPLVDTARGRRSIRVRASGRTIIVSTDAKYMGYHLSGDLKRVPPRPPRRAWGPFIWNGARWEFDARGKGGMWLRETRDRIKRYILTGKM